MKRCSRCGSVKALADFHQDKSRSDGRQRTYRTCKTAEAAERRTNDLGAYAAAQHAWRKRNPAAARAIRNRSIPEPTHRAARRAVAEAVRVGVLVRPETCSACGVQSKVHAHHTDYSRALDVTWLCEPCHLLEHGKRSRLIDPSAVQADWNALAEAVS